MAAGAGRWIVALASAALLASALVACGGSSNQDDNSAKIEAAEAEDEQLSAVESEVEMRLLTFETASSGGPWFQAGGGECSLNDVDVGEDAAVHDDDEQAVVSPDGEVAITTVPVIELGGADQATQADCLEAVVKAMGWDE